MPLQRSRHAMSSRDTQCPYYCLRDCKSKLYYLESDEIVVYEVQVQGASVIFLEELCMYNEARK